MTTLALLIKIRCKVYYLYTLEVVIIKNIYELTLLYDFYGQLLTEKQIEVFDLHYNNDYSLSEIAEELNISRQGVYDAIKRAREVLNDLESKLGLVRKFMLQKEKAEEAMKCIDLINKKNICDENKNLLQKVKDNIVFIVQN